MAWRIAVITETDEAMLEMSMDELKTLIIHCAGPDQKAKAAIESGFVKADAYLRDATVKLR